MYSAYDKIPIQIPQRVFYALVFISGAFFLIAARLWYLQALNGAEFAAKSKNNRQKTVFVPPARGIMWDRNKVPLAKNRPAFNVQMYLNETPNLDQVLKKLAEVVGTPEEVFRERLNKQRGPRFRPRVLIRDASRDEVEKVLANRWHLPGVFVSHYPIRSYEYGSLAAHVLGHIREISQQELMRPQFNEDYEYQPGDLIGKYGLELRWERYLQGTRGTHSFVVNAHSVKIRDLPDQVPAIPGNVLELTLDKDVQLAADKALEGEWGAAVAIDPNSGEVFALSSAPAFDPNIFTGELTSKQWNQLVHGKEKVLNNRAIQEVYPPGSVFKMFLGAAGLAEGLITPSTRETCLGSYRVGNATFRCHKRSGHGSVDLDLALTVSCDVYFYALGQKLGIDRIHEYALRFGFGKPTGLDLLHEQAGLIPSTAWKRRAFAGSEESRWYPGETPSVAIGQGAVTVTPIQLAVALSAMVNGGKVYRPFLVRSVYSNDGKTLIEKRDPIIESEVEIDPAFLDEVRVGLVDVVNSTRGTARRAKLPKEWEITVGGKTGTSQVVALSLKTDKREHEHHALFVGYAPAENPEIVVAAVVEHGGSGGLAAAPVVQKVMEAYFHKTRGLELPVEEVEDKKKASASAAEAEAGDAGPVHDESVHESDISEVAQ